MPEREHKCEGCLKVIDWPSDYCAHCSRNLCPACMQRGCCGHVPADSGQEADYGNDKEEKSTDDGTDQNP